MSLGNYLKEKGVIRETDYKSIADEIVRRYEGDKTVDSIAQLKEENPDLAPFILTLADRSRGMFGTSLMNYLKEKGVIKETNYGKALTEILRKNGVGKYRGSDDQQGKSNSANVNVPEPVIDDALPVPESEKVVLSHLISDLNNAYPDHIVSGLNRDHKKWDEKVTRLYKNIGYASRNEFLNAYGFKVEILKNGRKQENDWQSILDTILEGYEGDKTAKNIPQLREENPDIAPKIKSLQNKAIELYGMPLSQYLMEKGVLKEGRIITKKTKEGLDSLLDRLKEVYKDKEKPTTVTRVDIDNPELNIQSYDNIAHNAYDKTLKDLLLENGIIVKKENAATSRELLTEEMLNETIAELKKRYESKEKPETISVLEFQNPDLHIKGYQRVITATYKKTITEYLTEQGLLEKKPKEKIKAKPNRHISRQSDDDEEEYEEYIPYTKRVVQSFHSSKEVEDFCKNHMNIPAMIAAASKIGIKADMFKGMHYIDFQPNETA